MHASVPVFLWANQVLAPDEVYSCIFQAFISGNDGETHVNEFTVTATSDDGDPLAATAQAIVTIPGQLPAIEVKKIAVPLLVGPSGGTVNYLVLVQNVSSAEDPVTITSLVDEVDGVVTSLDGVGTCDITDLVLQPEPDPNSVYTCTFTQDLPPGSPGDTIEDIVTAAGVDDEGNPAVGSDNAMIAIEDDIYRPAAQSPGEQTGESNHGRGTRFPLSQIKSRGTWPRLNNPCCVAR
jgi:hypothetical protein